MRIEERAESIKYRVLIVDDDPLARAAMARILRGEGLIVDLASDGQEALTLATRFPYAVVVTDLRMPGMEGDALIRELKSARPDSIYLLVSGESSPSRTVNQLSSFIQKPFSNVHFAATVSDAVALYREGKASAWGASGVETAQSQELCVLVVEDNEADLMIVTRGLKKNRQCQYDVVSAASVQEATQLLEAGLKPQAILTDLTLPDCTGLDTVVQLLPVAHGSPIVVLSGQTNETLAFRAVEMGAQDYLVKGEINGDLLHRSLRYAMERKRSDERLRYLALHDQLTGLGNRTKLREKLEEAMLRANRRQEQVGLMYLDLNGFKQVNDTFGHAAGDALLQEVARRLVGSVRELDIVARMGGDEFAIVLEGPIEADHVQVVAQRILNAFATPIDLGEQELTTNSSIGIALYPVDARDIDKLLNCADAAMYSAKRTGKGVYEFFQARQTRLSESA